MSKQNGNHCNSVADLEILRGDFSCSPSISTTVVILFWCVANIHNFYIVRVSEYLVCQAGKQGLPVAVYRLGMISWSTNNGKANKVCSKLCMHWYIVSCSLRLDYLHCKSYSVYMCCVMLVHMQRDWLYRLIHGIDEMCASPQPLEASISLLPVDHLAQSVMTLSHQVTSNG